MLGGTYYEGCCYEKSEGFCVAFSPYFRSKGKVVPREQHSKAKRSAGAAQRNKCEREARLASQAPAAAKLPQAFFAPRREKRRFASPCAFTGEGKEKYCLIIKAFSCTAKG